MPKNKKGKVEEPFNKTKFFQQLKPEGIPVLEPSVKVEDTTTIIDSQ